MELIKLPTGDLSNIPLLLRRLADAIESGDKQNVVNAVVVTEKTDANVDVYGMGSCHDTWALGILARGMWWLGRDRNWRI